MKSVTLLSAAVMLACANAQALDLAAEARADRQAAQAVRESHSSVITPKSLACGLPSPLPVSPPNGDAAGSFDATWGNNDGFTATVWREPCAGGGGSVMYLRATPTLGAPFVCSSAFAVLQNFTQYDVKLVQTNSGTSFCDDLLAPVTMAVDQWSFDPKFDQSAPFTLVYKGVYQNMQGAVLASNGAHVKPWVMIELSATEEANMRGAINYYNDNPSNPFLRLVLEERTFARYSTLAQFLGMKAPPPR